MNEIYICSKATFGLRDCKRPVLWFGVEAEDKNKPIGACLLFELGEAIKLLYEHNIRDIAWIEGKRCVCNSEGAGFPMRFSHFIDEPPQNHQWSSNINA